MKKLFATLPLLFLISACSPRVETDNHPAGSLTVPAGPGTGAGGLGIGPSPVLLGYAQSFAVLAQTAISTVPSSSISGNIGISPATAKLYHGIFHQRSSYKLRHSCTGRRANFCCRL